MLSNIAWIWAAFAVLLLLAGLRRLLERGRHQSRSALELDDEAIERILRHGTLGIPDEEPLDEDEIARAEAEFWDESWDDPDEYAR
jgi:hypothetical protein